MKQEYVRETSRFGQFIKKEEDKRKIKEKIKQTLPLTKLQLLYDVILNEERDIKDYLEWIPDISQRGFVYEALWDVVILLEFLQEYKDGYEFYPYKIESGDILSRTKLNIKTYLDEERVISGNKRGVSDITLVKTNSSSHKTDGWACSQSLLPDSSNSKIELVFFSSKYFSKEKDIGAYDIERIYAMGQDITKKINGEDTDKSFKINLLVKNKNEFWKKFENAKSQKEGYQGTFQNVYDLQDLCTIIQEIRDNKDAIIKMLDEQETRAKKNKPYLIPRFHQLLFVLKSLDILCKSTANGFIINDDVKQPRVLWGQIPRSGKTYTAGLLVSKLHKGGFFENKSRNCVLVITPAPKETIDQFTIELFKKYKDFDDFEVLHYESKLYKQLETKKKVLEASKKYIFVASKQFLQASKTKSKNEYDDYEDEEVEIDSDKIKKQCTYLRERIGLLFFDEIHYGGSTTISNMILDAIDPYHNALQVFLTATYKKPVIWYNILSSQLMLWNIEDIHLCKKITSVGVLDTLEDKYGSNYIQRTLQELCLTYNSTMANMLMRIEDEYNKYPDIHFITTTFTEEAITLLKKPSTSSEYGFDINSLFSMEEYKVDGKKERRFQDEDNVTRLLSIVEKKLDTSVMPILQEYNASQKHVFTSQLWFLPFFKNNKIGNMAPLVKALIEKKGLFKDYKVITLLEVREDKNTVKKEEMDAWRAGKKGLIILVGKKLSLGVSLPCTDLVLFLNNDSEVDVIYQRMFRSLTERDSKKVGFVMDMNPIRTISATLDYSFSPEMFQDGKRPSIDKQIKKLQEMMENNIIYIDADILQLSNLEKSKREELYNKVETLLRDTEYIRITKTLDENIDSYMDTIFKDFDIMEWKDVLISTSVKKQKKNNLETPSQIVPYGKPNKKNSGTPDPDSVKKEADMKKEEANKKKNIMNAWKDIIVITAFIVTGSEDINSSRTFTQLLDRLIPDIDENPYTNIKTCSVEDPEKELHEVYKFLKELFCIKITSIIHIQSDNPETFVTDRILMMIKDILRDPSKSTNMNKIFENSKMVLMNIDNKNIRELHAYVEKYLPPKEHEKKKNGEVFTPLSLVEEMLGAITKYADQNFWKNKDLKILDPAAGIGNFPLIAYEKLMDGLKHTIPSEEKRSKHILENMLYMIELNPVNVRIMKRIFNSKKYKLNIIQGDALKESTHEKLFKMANTEKFDLIMGNPPYQAPNRGNTNTLWNKFINVYLPIVKDKSLFVFVTPSAWRDVNGKFKKIQDMFLSRQILYLEIHDLKDGQKMFHSSTRYDWYIIKNISSYKSTKIRYQDGKNDTINITNKIFIPNIKYDILDKLIAKTGEDTVSVLHEYIYDHRDLSKIKTDEYKYPCINSINKDNNANILYSSINIGHFGIPKFIWSNGAGTIVDDKGKYGLTEYAYAIIDTPKNLPYIKKVFDNPDFIKLMKSCCAVAQNNINFRVIALFKKDFWKEFLKSHKN